MAHPGGRPTKYSRTMLSQAQKYIDSCVDESYTIVKSQNKRGKILENKLRVRLPTIEGLAFHLKINRATIYEWKKEHPEFSDIIGNLLALQEDRLINEGLAGNYNATIAKVLLTKHGYRESRELAGAAGARLFRPTAEDRAVAERALSQV